MDHCSEGYAGYVFTGLGQEGVVLGLFGKGELLLILYTAVSDYCWGGLGGGRGILFCGIFFVTCLASLYASVVPIQISHFFCWRRTRWNYLQGF